MLLANAEQGKIDAIRSEDLRKSKRMSIHPKPISDVPELTARVAKAAFPKGNVYMQMRDVFGTFFEDDQFVDLYAKDGQSSLSPWRLALVCVMQFAENLSDRQAADAVRARIDWKYALSLELDDAGFDFSALSEFRQRLIDSPDVERIFNRLLAVFQQQGLLSAGGRQRTDSTHIFASVRRLNRVATVGQTLYHALNMLATEAPEWLQAWAPPPWYERYSQPLTDYRLPQEKAEQSALARSIGTDGLQLLEALWFDPRTPHHLKHLKAIQTLRQVWVQQYYVENDVLDWREGKDLPPAEQLIQSPFDPEARYSNKRTIEWIGYKVHLSETCNTHTPNLVTHVETTLAPIADQPMVDTVHERLQDKGYLPDEHLVDQGYSSAAQLVTSKSNYGVELISLVSEPTGWQAKAKTGFDLAAFQIDWERKQVVCPEGKVSRTWSNIVPARGNNEHLVRFSPNDCRICPSKVLCTKGNLRTIGFHSKPLVEALRARRVEQHTEAFRKIYRKRNGIEGTISQACMVLGMRRTRYRGLAKTHLQHLLTAAAMNLTRAINWLAGIPKATTRISPFAALAPA